MKKVRESNIDLLRIISMLNVIILHYVNEEIGGGLEYVEEDSINYYILYFFQSISVSAVNIFVLITGYFMSRFEKRSLIKPIELLFQVVLFNELLYIIPAIIDGNFAIKEVLYRFLPSNWFVILYIALYLISPYINLIIKALDKNKFRNMVILLFLIFSVYATAEDLLSSITGSVILQLSPIGISGNQDGYTIVNFVLLYLIGALFVDFEFKNLKSIKLIGLLLGNMLIIFVMSGIYPTVAWAYCSPFVISEAVILFLLFKNLKIKPNKVISSLAQCTFVVYMIHTELYKFIGYFVRSNPVFMVLHMIGSAVLIYLIGYVMFVIYSKLSKPLHDAMNKKFKFLKWDISQKKEIKS